MTTSKPKTKKSPIFPGISDFWMFLIGLGLVLSSNFSDLQQYGAKKSNSFSTEMSGKYSESYVSKDLSLVSDKKNEL